MAPRTIKRKKVSKLSRKIFEINKKLTKEISKRKKGSSTIDTVFIDVSKKINKKLKKTLKRKKSGASSKGTKGKNKIINDKLTKLSNQLSIYLKKVLNGKTDAQNSKKLEKLRKDLFILGNSQRKRAASSTMDTIQRTLNAPGNKVEEAIDNKYLGKALGAVVKASTWVAAAGAGVLAADYVTDGIVDSFDSCAATGFFDGPDLSFLPGV